MTSTPESPRRSAYAAAAATILFWGIAFTGIAMALESFGPGELACMRFLIASTVLLLVGAATRSLRRVALADLPRLVGTSVLGISAYHLCINFGQRVVPPGTTALIIQTAPVVTALLATRFGGEAMSRRGWLGIALGIAGGAILVFGQGRDVRFTSSASLIVAASVVTSVYFVFQKPLVVKYGVQTITTLGIAIGTVPLLYFLPSGLRQWSEASSASIGALFFIALFPAALAYSLWNFAISRLGASRAASLTYASPVIAILAQWVWRGDVPPPIAWAAGFVLLAGVFVVNTERFSRLARPASGEPVRPPTDAAAGAEAS